MAENPNFEDHLGVHLVQAEISLVRRIKIVNAKIAWSALKGRWSQPLCYTFHKVNKVTKRAFSQEVRLLAYYTLYTAKLEMQGRWFTRICVCRGITHHANPLNGTF
jgi:hypothetical protein